ncbi:MAG: ferredoxin reductase [Frankiaceae bacterium]|nr:ferredoxin reductase [Frankiaceae bacterium]
MTTAAPVLRVRDRLRDRVAQLAELVATPLVPADYVDLLDPLRNGTDLRARIVAVTAETADAATLELRPGRGWRGHVPGQYVRIGVDVDGVRLWRAYSVTSSTDTTFTITVKAIPDGVVSNHLVRRARAGSVVQLDQATGDFVLPTSRPTKALFVTAGSGITPVMGMLRSTPLDDVVLVHSAPTADDVIFATELRTWATQGRISLVEKHTDTDGMLTTDELAAVVPDLSEREAWACGPTGMLDALETWWPNDLLHTERFRPSVLVLGDGGSVTFARSGTTVDADGATPLLTAGEAAGVLMPSGCRMGICFGCVLPLREGAVRDLRTGDVTTAAVGDGVLIQTCISAAAGPCDLDV